LPIRKEEGHPPSGGWSRSDTTVVLGTSRYSDRATEMIDELLRLVTFMRKSPFPSAPAGLELGFKEIMVDPAAASPEKSQNGKRGKTRRKGKKLKVEIIVEKYYVADRIHDVWDQFQTDYAHLTKMKPGEESVFLKYLVQAMNNSTLVSTNMADLQRLLKIYKKKAAKDGFPFPPNYFEGRPQSFPGKRAKSSDSIQTHRGQLLPLVKLGSSNSSNSQNGREVGDVIAQPSEDEDDDAQQAEGEEGGEGVEGEEGTDATDPVPVEEEEEEEEEDEEQAKQLAKIKKFDVSEFHGVMYLALVAFRVDGHFKGSDVGEGKGKRKGKKGKKK